MTSMPTYQLGRENQELSDSLDSNYVTDSYFKDTQLEEQTKYLAAVDAMIRNVFKDSPDTKIVYVFMPMSPQSSYSAQPNSLNSPNSKDAYSHMKSTYSGKNSYSPKSKSPSSGYGGRSSKAATSKSKGCSYSSK